MTTFSAANDDEFIMPLKGFSLTQVLFNLSLY